MSIGLRMLTSLFRTWPPCGLVMARNRNDKKSWAKSGQHLVSTRVESKRECCYCVGRKCLLASEKKGGNHARATFRSSGVALGFGKFLLRYDDRAAVVGALLGLI